MSQTQLIYTFISNTILHMNYTLTTKKIFKKRTIDTIRKLHGVEPQPFYFYNASEAWDIIIADKNKTCKQGQNKCVFSSIEYGLNLLKRLQEEQRNKFSKTNTSSGLSSLSRKRKTSIVSVDSDASTEVLDDDIDIQNIIHNKRRRINSVDYTESKELEEDEEETLYRTKINNKWVAMKMRDPSFNTIDEVIELNRLGYSFSKI